MLTTSDNLNRKLFGVLVIDLEASYETARWFIVSRVPTFSDLASVLEVENWIEDGLVGQSRWISAVISLSDEFQFVEANGSEQDHDSLHFFTR
jgi:hypothetical protein